MADLTLRVLVLAAALAQIVAPAFVNPFRDGGAPLRGGEPSQIEPAAYAFSIWGLIYLLALGYSAWQLTPAGRADPMTARVAPLALALYLGSPLWLIAAKYGPLWATMPILAAMAACACVALISFAAAPRPSISRWWLAVLPFGLYAGWTTCATFVNVAEVAPAYGFDRFGLSIPAYGALSIGAATLLAGVVLWLCGGEAAFAATVAWALAAIIVAARQRGAHEAVPIAAALGILAIAALSGWLKIRGRPRSAP